MDGLIADITGASRVRGPADAAALLAAARVRAMAARSRSSRRVFLVSPVLWKSARAAAPMQAMDWSAPSCARASARPRPNAAPLPARRGSHWLVLRVLVRAALPWLRPFAWVALQGVARAGRVGVRVMRPVHCPAWRFGAVRPMFAMASLCAVGVALVVMLTARPSPNPQNAVVTRVVIAPRVPQAAPADGLAHLPALRGAVSTTAAVVPPDAPSALLADVSTMDLMMPVAEPDLDIASPRSLWAQVGRQAGVDPLLLYSVALVESRALLPDGKVGPTPWLFRVNDRLVTGSRHHVQLQMAVASQLSSAVQDVGIMQVYYPMHRDAVRDPLTLLDPRTNITVAAGILRAGMRETRDPVMGVGYYHSHTPQLARDYGTAVMTVYQRLKRLQRPRAPLRLAARQPLTAALR